MTPPIPYYIGAFWPTRPWSQADASQFSEMLDEFQLVGQGALRQWFLTADNIEAARKVKLGAEALTPNEAGHVSVSAWTGEESGAAASLQLLAGHTQPWEKNRFSLRFAAQLGLPLSDPRAAREVLASVARHLRPDWAALSPWDWEDKITPPKRGKIGWMTYFSADRAAIPTSVESNAEPVDQVGWIVRSTDVLFDPANPAHVASAQALAQRLLDAGVTKL